MQSRDARRREDRGERADRGRGRSRSTDKRGLAHWVRRVSRPLGRACVPRAQASRSSHRVDASVAAQRCCCYRAEPPTRRHAPARLLAKKFGSPGMIVGDDTRTRVRPGPPNRVTRMPPQRSPVLGKTRRMQRQNGATRGGMEHAAPRHATAPVNAGNDPTAPQRRPTGASPP